MDRKASPSDRNGVGWLPCNLSDVRPRDVIVCINPCFCKQWVGASARMSWSSPPAWDHRCRDASFAGPGIQRPDRGYVCETIRLLINLS